MVQETRDQLYWLMSKETISPRREKLLQTRLMQHTNNMRMTHQIQLVLGFTKVPTAPTGWEVKPGQNVYGYDAASNGESNQKMT